MIVLNVSLDESVNGGRILSLRRFRRFGGLADVLLVFLELALAGFLELDLHNLEQL